MHGAFLALQSESATWCGEVLSGGFQLLVVAWHDCTVVDLIRLETHAASERALDNAAHYSLQSATESFRPDHNAGITACLLLPASIIQGAASKACPFAALGILLKKTIVRLDSNGRALCRIHIVYSWLAEPLSKAMNSAPVATLQC